MYDTLNDLYCICDSVCRKLHEHAEKIEKQRNGEFPSNNLDEIDKLTHTLKSLKTSIAMMEAEPSRGWGSSERYMPSSYNSDRYSYRGRNSMGRYTKASELQGMVDAMRDMMGSLPEDERMEVQRFVEKMDRR